MSLERFVVVKKQTVKEDGKKYYGIYLIDRDLKKYIRILTFKDDTRGYALLDAIAYYVGTDDLSKYFNEACPNE